MKTTIDYPILIDLAMRDLIRGVLKQVEEDGLPGNHHFMISFDTTHPKVAMADWIREDNPKEMTIIMQNWFENLTVDEVGFSITLNFSDTAETLYIPFAAILTFQDPSTAFLLQLNSAATPEEPKERNVPKDEAKPHPKNEHERKEAEVVSLDQFRK